VTTDDYFAGYGHGGAAKQLALPLIRIPLVIPSKALEIKQQDQDMGGTRARCTGVGQCLDSRRRDFARWFSGAYEALWMMIRK